MSIQGKTVVFTGKISQPRHIFQKMVEEHGGIAGSDVSSHTDYLVVGEKPGSKLFRAASLGVKTISEADFLKLLEKDSEEEFRALSEEEPSPCGTTDGRHFWFRVTQKENGDTLKECLCGTTLLAHPDGTWEKHEPRDIIEKAKKAAHINAIKEERLSSQREEEAKRKEREIIDFIESLTPEQKEALRRQDGKVQAS